MAEEEVAEVEEAEAGARQEEQVDLVKADVMQEGHKPTDEFCLMGERAYSSHYVHMHIESHFAPYGMSFDQYLESVILVCTQGEECKCGI